MAETNEKTDENVLLEKVEKIYEILEQNRAIEEEQDDNLQIVTNCLDLIAQSLRSIFGFLASSSFQQKNNAEIQAVAAAEDVASTEAEKVVEIEKVEDALANLASTILPTTQQEEAAQHEDDSFTWIDRVENGLFKSHLSFDMKMRLQDNDVKEYYSDIKNHLLSFGIKNRMSHSKENFNRGRNPIARMAINGKTFVIYIAIDPSSLDENYYHHKDCSDKKLVKDLPTMIKIRSKLAAKKVCEIINLICEDLVIFRKPKYVPYDFAKDMTIDGFSTVERKGFDYLVRPTVELDNMKYYNDQIANQLVEPVLAKQPVFINKAVLTIDSIKQNFREGEIVDLDSAKQKGLCDVEKNYLLVKESDSLDRKFSVFANEFTPNAIKMLCLAGGEAYLLTESFEAFTEPDGEEN